MTDALSEVQEIRILQAFALLSKIIEFGDRVDQ